jgi:4-aminobutyrate aminotransferase/(S)-3-amino-2-methylpropionate transaminase
VTSPATSNADLLARRAAAVPRGVASIHPHFFERGANAEAFDAEAVNHHRYGGQRNQCRQRRAGEIPY